MDWRELVIVGLIVAFFITLGRIVRRATKSTNK